MRGAGPLTAPGRVFAWIALIALAASACGSGDNGPHERTPAHPMIVFGIDGGEWSVIERMWERGELPAMAALAEHGTRADLGTDYGASPVIWTTIATGRPPRAHGITNFFVPAERGDLPVSSDLRRVPALWNILSTAGRRVAVLGWWASWPAEEVEGVVVSDRALQERERLFYPESLEARLRRWLDRRPHLPRDSVVFRDGFESGDTAIWETGAGLRWDLEEIAQRRDRLVAEAGRELADEDFDLMLAYFRSADVESHNHWRFWQPERFPPPSTPLRAIEVAKRAERIPDVYRLIDRAIDDIVAAAPEANVLVVSDHGFRPAEEEHILLMFDLDVVLDRLGFLVPVSGGRVDLDASALYGYGSQPHSRVKPVRFGGAVPPRRHAALRERLERELERATWPSGEPVFRVRDADRSERSDGADFVVALRHRGAAEEILLDGLPFEEGWEGRPLPNPVLLVNRISGVHHRRTEGILIAAGPDIQPRARVSGISIHDLAATILYGLGLPVAEDFTGRAYTELFTREFRRRHELTTIESWGTREPGQTVSPQANQELLEELGALGYLR